MTIHDHYGQTELGMVLCNHHGLQHPVHLGSAGYAIPGHRIVVVDEQGNELPAGQPGILAVDREQSPLCWFGGYHGLPTKAFVGKYYLSGDTVELNPDGSISFVGRSDDVITTSGYRVGPFDVESALIEHPAVIEAAVIGKPDPERTELIKAFVVLASGCVAASSWKKPCASMCASASTRMPTPGNRIRQRAAQDPERQAATLHPAQPGSRQTTSATGHPCQRLKGKYSCT